MLLQQQDFMQGKSCPYYVIDLNGTACDMWSRKLFPESSTSMDVHIMIGISYVIELALSC
jgi:hypothetical protein